MRAKSMATLLLLGFAIFSFSKWAEGQSDIAVVVNPDNPAANISAADLRKFFLGTKRSWPGGPPVKLVTRGPGCPERVTMLRLLSMSESDYKQYWTAQVFRGEADAEPLIVPSVGMQKEALKTFSGAISLVIAREVKPGMKVLKVDGLLPGTVGYPLH